MIGQEKAEKFLFQEQKIKQKRPQTYLSEGVPIDEVYYKGLLLICVVLTILRLQIAQVRGIHHSKRHNYCSVASPLRCTCAYRL